MDTERLKNLANRPQKFAFRKQPEEIFEVPPDWHEKPIILLPDGRLVLPIPIFEGGYTFMSNTIEPVGRLFEGGQRELSVEELRSLAEKEGYTLATRVER